MLKWELYRCEVYVLRWELPRNRGLNLTPQAQGQRVSLSLLLTCFLTEKKKCKESMTQFQLKRQTTSIAKRACSPAVRSFLKIVAFLRGTKIAHLGLVRNALTTSLFPNKTSWPGFLVQ